ASGEVYDMHRLTAAHRTLPFDTWVRVTNVSNRREVDVRITDRGPFVAGRIIDLSRAAAERIGMIRDGTTPVRLKVLRPGRADSSEARYTVQAGAFQDRARAERLRGELERKFGFARLAPREGEPMLWRLLVGKERSLERAQELAGKVKKETGVSIVVRLDE
ncbi:MAG: septal ring lytic transglycosylase RlpA family protein, partial [Acidobacteria bacterium]|nr:septal ring lytic transglycosylase RlpA family protein [Acidobacteriota bacterium]